MKGSYYLPLLEFKALTQSLKELNHVVQYQNFNQDQQLIFDLMDSAPKLSIDYKANNDEVMPAI